MSLSLENTVKSISFDSAYKLLNERLFENQLGLCVITLNCDGVRKAFFVQSSFNEKDGCENCDEIALNPSLFDDQTDAEILSTLAHEMVHKWQHDYGKPGKNAYHNKEWAKVMKRIGLKPFNVTNPNRETGPACGHTIIEDGLFAQTYQELAVNEIRLDRQIQ
jgi:hypothetical protein